MQLSNCINMATMSICLNMHITRTVVKIQPKVSRLGLRHFHQELLRCLNGDTDDPCRHLCTPLKPVVRMFSSQLEPTGTNGSTASGSNISENITVKLKKLITAGPLHFRSIVRKDEPIIGSNALPHPIWNTKELEEVVITHREPEGFVDKWAYFSVYILRHCFDYISGYSQGVRNETMWVNRICFLETVAGVPGMVAAMVRHLASLRRMKRDHGWIHTLLEEAENERMHLMTALHLKQPGFLFRLAVICTQGVFVNAFSVSYLFSPRFCHRMVGYLEEEAVVTYTKLLKDIDSGCMQHWQTQSAPDIAIQYWQLPADATMRMVILVIRADEAHHRIVNHTLATIPSDQYNPYEPGK